MLSYHLCGTVYLFQGLVNGLHTFHKGDSKWIQLICLVGFVHIGQRDTESKPSQIAHL